MRDFQENRRMRAFFASRTVLTVLFLFLVGMGIVSFRALEAGWEVRTEHEAVEERLRSLEEKKQMLSSELEELRSEQGIEREAREKLNYRKPGEDVVIIRDGNVEHASEEKVEAGLFLRLLQWLGIR